MNPIRFIIFAFLLFTDGEPATAAVETVAEVIDVIEIIWGLKEMFDGSSKVIPEKLDEISNDIKNLEEMIIETNEAIQDLKRFIDLNLKFNQVGILMGRINFYFNSYESYLNRTDDLELEILLNFAKNVIEDSPMSVKGSIQQMHQYFFEMGLFEEKADDLKRNSGSCSSLTKNRSPQQTLIQIYKTVMLMEIKSEVMMQFAFFILTSHGKGNFTAETEIFKQDFESRISKSQTHLKHISEINRDLWRCDPEVHKENVTYLQLTRMLHGVTALGVQGIFFGCKYCSEKFEKHEEKFHNHNCDGSYYICRDVSEISSVDIFLACENSSRRYEYLEFKENSPYKFEKLGKRTDNNTSQKPVHIQDPYVVPTASGDFYTCPICFCICDGQKDSDRYFNLWSAISNIFNNRVVTGVRFIRQYQVIHLQIQEGQLLQQGQINSSTINWVPVVYYIIHDKDIKNGIHYHKMNWTHRHFDLDNLQAPKDHVVTGVKFGLIGKHLNLQIRVTQIDFESGKIVDPESSYWIGNDNTNSVYGNNHRDEIGLYLPDIPTRATTPSPKISHDNSYIKFTFSDKYKDASQTTVPFIDAQDVTNDPAVPLDGVGMILKAGKGYGGFVAPKITTFDFSPYV